MQQRRKVIRHSEAYRVLLDHLMCMRVRHDKTQGDVAKGLNLSRSQYTALEGGRSLLNVDHLCSLAHFYDQSVSDFLVGVL